MSTPLVWLVTGCSSGFGEQFVNNILKRGDRVIATARNVDKLKALKKAGASILRLDVTDEQQVLNKTIADAIKIYGTIDVLLNNAGYVHSGILEELEYEDLLAQFDTNTFGPIKVTRALLPHLRQKKAGTVVFISSLSGWYSDGATAAYSGSKFALEGLAEGLSREVAPFGIKTLIVEPGMFRTKLLTESNMKPMVPKISDYAELAKEKSTWLTGSNEAQPGDPEKAVKIILDFVRHEGVAANKQIPLRLPVGSDAYLVLKTKCDETLKLLEDWEPAIKSTEFSEQGKL